MNRPWSCPSCRTSTRGSPTVSAAPPEGWSRSRHSAAGSGRRWRWCTSSPWPGRTLPSSSGPAWTWSHLENIVIIRLLMITGFVIGTIDNIDLPGPYLHSRVIIFLPRIFLFNISSHYSQASDHIFLSFSCEHNLTRNLLKFYQKSQLLFKW